MLRVVVRRQLQLLPILFGVSILLQTSQLVFFPGLAIVLAVLGFNLLGDALREALDPKLQR